MLVGMNIKKKGKFTNICLSGEKLGNDFINESEGMTQSAAKGP